MKKVRPWILFALAVVIVATLLVVLAKSTGMGGWCHDYSRVFWIALTVASVMAAVASFVDYLDLQAVHYHTTMAIILFSAGGGIISLLLLAVGFIATL